MRGAETMAAERKLSEDIEREGPRLRRFIRRRVPDEADVEDILQDVFSELVEAYRLAEAIGNVSAWLFRVAGNRITDRFRKRHTQALPEAVIGEDGESLGLDELLSSEEAGPEADYLRGMLLDELDAALEELPEEQQQVFIAHEFEGRSFKDLSAETGESVNTLLSRKHYAVKHLRKRLRAIYEEFKET